MLVWGAATSAAAAEAAESPLRLPTVTVTGTLPPGRVAARPTVVIGREELARMPAQSVTEALRFLPGLSLQSRGLGPVQGDLSFRGSTFSQVLILIDGVRISDPQTAHHNLDIPLSLADVERIEILQGPACARYGADAVAGAVNIITRRPRAACLRAEAAGGSFGTNREALTAGGRLGSVFSGTVSAAREASDGYRFDTDYEVRTLSGALNWEGRTSTADAFFGLQEKEFGAYDFYSPGMGFASREQTGTRLAALSWSNEDDGRLLEARASFREHDDDFVLDFRNPALSSSDHRTDVAGVQIFGQRPQGSGLLSAGIELRGETINSNTLGNHQRGVVSPFAEYALALGPLDVDGALRLDIYSRLKSPQASPALALAWRLPGGFFSARAQAATAYRVPSYTELYYLSPANIGDSGLKPERSLNYGAGLLFNRAGWPVEASLDTFERQERDVIDWVRENTSEPWRAVNSGRIRVRGLETQAAWHAPWGGARLDFVILSKKLNPEAAFSKYVLTNPGRQLGVQLWRDETPWLPVALFAALSWRHYSDQEYAVVDLCVSKRYGVCEVFAEGHNLLDADYSEAMVPAPGIWGLGGLRLYLGR
ncbi:MAG: TonB-dependent receptor [Pseudomonadota bacterium]